MDTFTHFDEDGNAIMVDVSGKPQTERTAIATGTISMNEECFQAVTNHSVKKGDVLGVARVAAIMGAKKTWEIIPLCHPLALKKINVDFETDAKTNSVTVFVTVKTTGQTGVEMEALTGVNIALLTIYDMCKAIDKRMVMSQIHLCEKKGGKSGDFYFEEQIDA